MSLYTFRFVLVGSNETSIMFVPLVLLPAPVDTSHHRGNTQTTQLQLRARREPSTQIFEWASLVLPHLEGSKMLWPQRQLVRCLDMSRHPALSLLLYSEIDIANRARNWSITCAYTQYGFSTGPSSCVSSALLNLIQYLPPAPAPGRVVLCLGTRLR